MTANFFEFQQQLKVPRPTPPPTPAREEAALSVSEVTSKITRALSGGLPPALLVRGEVSNFSRNRGSGHLYFTLKDPDACLDCVMFRGEAARLKFEPDDGMELLASGRIGVFPARGRYQLYVSSLRPLGQGALELAFQQVRAKLEAAGLFAPERKKPLPRYPTRIAIVTSREAAALQDVLKVLRRFAWLRLMLYPAPVQGDGAGAKLAAAIAHLNERVATRGGADLMLLVRGGGSLEDLWAFNEEAVARAIAASRIPVVTGIGHEVDVSIADLVADHHAHTPTEAAQVVTARWRGVEEHLGGVQGRITRAVRTAVSENAQRLRAVERHETFRRPADRINSLRQLLDERQRAMLNAEARLLQDRRDRLQACTARLERFLPSVLNRFKDVLNLRRQQLDRRVAARVRESHERLGRAADLLQDCHPRLVVKLAAQQIGTAAARLDRSAGQMLAARKQGLEAMARELEAVSPQSVLRRGYTITVRKKDGQPLRRPDQVKPGEKILTRFADGEVESVVEDSRQLSLFD